MRLCGTFGGLYMTSGNSQCSCAGLRTRLHTIWAWKTSWRKCSNVLALMQRPRGSGNAPLYLASEGSSRSGLPQFLYHARAMEDPFDCVKSWTRPGACSPRNSKCLGEHLVPLTIARFLECLFSAFSQSTYKWICGADSSVFSVSVASMGRPTELESPIPQSQVLTDLSYYGHSNISGKALKPLLVKILPYLWKTKCTDALSQVKLGVN